MPNLDEVANVFAGAVLYVHRPYSSVPVECEPMRFMMIPALMALLVASDGHAQSADAVGKVEQLLTLKRLEGTWVPDVLLTPQGAESYPLSGRSLSFVDGKQFVRWEGKRKVALGTFAIEEGFLRLTTRERNPWDLETSAPKEKVQYAFKVEGDVLTLCYTVGDKGKADDLRPGEGRQVIVYKRQR